VETLFTPSEATKDATTGIDEAFTLLIPSDATSPATFGMLALGK